MNKHPLVKVTEVRLNGIPCTYVSPNFISGNLPTIFLYHGWSSNKENFKFIAKVLGQNGYKVIVPDAVDHGERAALDYENIEVMRLNFWRVVFETVNEFSGLLTEAKNKLNIDEDNMAIMGSSMGGFISGGIFAKNKNIKCLINMNGSCAWENAEQSFRNLHGLKFATEEQLIYIRENDPMNFKQDFYPRGILLLHGDADTQVSIETQRYFYSEIKNFYGDSGNIELIESPRLDHYKTIKMLEDSIVWLNRFLVFNK